jgi:hypothetical protein
MKRLLQLSALILALGGAGSAQQRQCPTIMPTLRAWDELYKSFELFQNCDDGAIAEGYSESVARILVDRWSTLPRFSFLGTKNVAFRKFVLKHVDASLDTRDLQTIKEKATTQCPDGLRSVCHDLRKQADAALKEGTASH